MDLTKKLRVKSITDGVVVTIAPSFNNRRREWPTKGSTSWVTIEELEDVMQTYGGNAIVKENLYVYADEDEKMYLGLPIEEEADLSVAGLNKLFALDMRSFLNVVEQYPLTARQAVANEAIKRQLADATKCDILYELTGIDVFEQIAKTRVKRSVISEIKGENKEKSK